MALDLAYLRAIARGDVEPEKGRNHVTDAPVTCLIAPVTPQGYAKKARSYAGYASKNQVWKRDADEGRCEGVTGGVTRLSLPPESAVETRQGAAQHRSRSAAVAGLSDRWCACGTMATVAIGSFRADVGNPEGVERWLCSECFEAERG